MDVLAQARYYAESDGLVRDCAMCIETLVVFGRVGGLILKPEQV